MLRENGIIEISDEDISAIVNVAERGKAGQNSHIGWYKKNGSILGSPMIESDKPLLVKCASPPFNISIPKGEIVLKSSSTSTESSSTPSQSRAQDEVCGPALILGLLLVPLLFRKLSLLAF